MEEAKQVKKTEKKTGENVLKTLKSEFQKITWLDQNTFIRQTIAVVAVAVFLGILIALIDFILKYAVNLIL